MKDILADERSLAIKSLIDPIRIKNSCNYCQSIGLDPELNRPMSALVGNELDVFLAQHAALNSYSHQLFGDIYRDLRDRNWMFALSDDEARLITLYTHPDILGIAMEELGLHCGVSLSEASCGTNALALALRYQEPMITRKEQHYCRIFQGWCIVAVPVIDVGHQLKACVAISNCSGIALKEILILASYIALDFGKFMSAFSAAPREGNNDNLVNNLPQVNLTQRQLQVLQLFAKGYSYKQIARLIGIGSYKTVEEHLDAVREKLHVSSRRECIHKAMAVGLLKE